MSKIELLDCTLRDGAYVVESNFGETAIKGILEKLKKAGTEIIECGWLKNSAHKQGTTFYHVPSDFENYLTSKDKRITYTAMIDWDRYDLDSLPVCDGRSIDAIRVVFPHGRHKEGVEVGRRIIEKGYKVYFQAANTLAYSNEDLEDLAETVNGIDAVGLSIVDTFGAMYAEDLDRIISVLNRKLKPGIRIGFHSHNNQQLSFALTMHFTQEMQKLGRDAVIDASLCGMGRGAGNATTELVVNYLNRKCGKHYDLDEIMDAIDVYMCYFQENYQWGYSTPYFIAGMYCCHVNNIAYLLKNHRAKAKDIRNIIGLLSPDERKKYDYDILEQKYLKNADYSVDDAESIEILRKTFDQRTVMLIAPGRSSIEEQEKIREIIRETNAAVIGVNAILPGYNYDYVLFVNAARYSYAGAANPEVFAKCRKIVLSNIKAEAGENELVISFNRAIRRGWEHFDNAVICCLRLIDKIGVDDVIIAGFDGFKDKYNESYADPFLPTINPGKKWNELNIEIREMFENFLETRTNCNRIRFATESYFEVKGE